MRSRLISVSLGAAALLVMACGSDSSGATLLNESTNEGPLVVRDNDTFTVDSFINAGWKKNREQDVSSLERATSGWYGFFNRRDIELWVYSTNAEANEFGVPAAEAILDKREAGNRWPSVGKNITRFTDYMIAGNVCCFHVPAAIYVYRNMKTPIRNGTG